MFKCEIISSSYLAQSNMSVTFVAQMLQYQLKIISVSVKVKNNYFYYLLKYAFDNFSCKQAVS